MSEDNQNQSIRISAGEQLKHLREQKNLSVQDIASRLNLEPRIIEAIEHNEFEKLTAATYARGYLRSYAKLLGADPEGIIASYNDSAPEPPEIIPEVKHSTQTSSNDKPVKAFTYLISLMLVILLVAWWQSKFIVDNVSRIVKKDLIDDVERPYALSYPIEIVVHPDSPFYRAPEAREKSLPNEEDTIAKDSSIDTSDSSLEDTAEADQEAYPQNVSTDNVGPDTLILKLSDDSWIEVFDALENKVYVNLAHGGQTLTLQGTAPFDLVVGVATAVIVEFNGEVFDTSPYTKGGIARFSLDR